MIASLWNNFMMLWRPDPLIMYLIELEMADADDDVQ